jgi:hypothetical protein
MCDCCKAEGKDFKFSNGENASVSLAKLYKVYVGKVANVQLCRLCDIELFHKGEIRFLRSHLTLAQEIVTAKAGFMGHLM